MSLQNVNAAMSLQELALGNVSTGHFRAANATYYLVEGDSDARLDMEALLAPLSRLPKEVTIESVHLISRNEGLWVFPLHDVRAFRNIEGGMDINAVASIAQRRVLIDSQADWSRQARGHRLRFSASVSGGEEGSHLRTRGHIDAMGPTLSYELAVEGRYERVSDFLRVFDANAYPFAGTLSLEGTLKGDTQGYTLSLDEIGLNEESAYNFTAKGQLIQRGSSQRSLKLSAKGSAMKLEELVPLDGGLAKVIQRSEIEIDIAGSLAAPEIQHVGLVLYGAGDLRLSLDSQIQALQLEDLEGLLARETANATLEGTIGNLGELLVNTGAASREYVVAAGLNGATASFKGTGQGGKKELRVNLQNLLLSHAGYVIDGSANLVWREDVLSAPEFQLQLRDGKNRTRIEARGTVADLLETHGMAVELQFDELPTTPLLQSVALKAPGHLESVTGTALLLRGGDTLRLRDVDLEIEVLPEVTAELQGEGDFFQEELSADLKLQLQPLSYAAWRTLSPLSEPPSRLEANLRLRPRYLTVLSEAIIGDTAIQGVASADLDRGVIDRLSLDLYSPHLHLNDVALRPENIARKETRNPKNKESGDSIDFEALGDFLPGFPVALTLRSGEVTGPLTQLEDLSVALDLARRRLTLTELDARYAGGELMLRGNIDGTVTPTAISLAGRGIRVPLGALTTDLGLQQSVSGALSFQGGLVARGSQKEDWERTMQGRLSTALSDVTVSGAAYDLLMSNLLVWLVRGAGEKTTTFNCTMAQFDISAGVARSDSIYVETPRMLATGKATVDLSKNNLDVRIEPRSKSRAIQFPSAIRLRGALDAPKVSASALQASADLSAQALLLLPSLTLKLFGLDGPDDLNQPCETTDF